MSTQPFVLPVRVGVRADGDEWDHMTDAVKQVEHCL